MSLPADNMEIKRHERVLMNVHQERTVLLWGTLIKANIFASVTFVSIRSYTPTSDS